MRKPGQIRCTKVHGHQWIIEIINRHNFICPTANIPADRIISVYIHICIASEQYAPEQSVTWQLKHAERNMQKK